MNIRVETAGTCRKNIHVEVPADQVSAEFGEVTQAYIQYAKIPGFRPGRAPLGLIQKRYAKEIAQEVKERLVPKGYQHAVKQESLQTVAVLDVKEEPVEAGHPFSFTVIVDVAPDFELPKYEGIKLEGKKVEIGDEDVKGTIDRLREQGGTFEDVTTRGVQKGDLVKVDYEGTLDGKNLEEIAPGAAGLGKGKDFWLMADQENEFLPGFSTALLGAKVGEKKQIEVEFPADFAEKAVAGKKASYAAEVTAIRERKLAEINEEFLKSLGVDSEETLKRRVREDLQSMREGGEKRRLQGEIIKKLLEETKLDVPESVLATETRNEVYDLVQQTSHRGASADDIEGKKEELFEVATKNATERVKLRYILRRIAAQEKVEVTKEEFDARIQGLAAQHRVPADRVIADLKKNESLGRLEDEVRLNKTLALILDKAEVKLSS